MRVGGVDADLHLFGDLFGREAFDEADEDFLLAWGECDGRGGGLDVLGEQDGGEECLGEFPAGILSKSACVSAH